ncbi:hypothetical protein GCM10023189_51760 [Nibrella saemangeumensis]|uniref:Uncharacterized protein n=1 Tax=Nibrella saemangeumensis TaxID=1084526 RepID=A0ABP8NIN0_9BACT
MENRLNITKSAYYLNERVARLTRRQLSIPKKALIQTCRVKMLVVTDYGGSFGDNEGFGLGHFLRAFDEPLPFTSFEITKAHRRSDEDADIENFRFHEHDLSRYDVIWLFAVERPAFRPSGQPVLTLTDAELRAVSEYMDQGGGIFATGDHEDLGVDMCGRIPRIRSMRRWFTAANPGPNEEPFAPAQTGIGRHDTIVDINPALAGVQGDQSDLTPQKIKLNYRYRTYHMGSVIRRQVKYPHLVLCSPDGAINVLPDHMHEGNCEVPADLTKAFNFAGYAIQEYPMVGRARLTPEVIAEAVNHVTNSDFGVIAVLDGHQTNQIGRVLVDATWHHFFNINIAQFGQLKQAVTMV